jgi:nicotinamidase-related amidase
VASEHWGSSGFANTDLDLALKKHGIHKLIVMGLIAHNCVEATVRFAAELGYEVTMVKDATADYSDKEPDMNAKDLFLRSQKSIPSLSFRLTANPPAAIKAWHAEQNRAPVSGRH